MAINIILIIFFYYLSSCKPVESINPESQGLKNKIISIAKQNHIPTLSVLIRTKDILIDFQYKDNDIVIKPMTRYGVASTTKFLSSLLILKYVEENKINLDDPISKFVDAPIFKKIDWFESITIKNLLNHTSGIPDYTQNPSWITAVKAKNPPTNYDEKMAMVNAPDTSHHFSKFAYSNSNYVILEKIIEVITHQNAIVAFDAYYDRLGIQGISFEEPIDNNQGFFAQQENQTSDISEWKENYGFEGGAYASVYDLSKILQKVFIEKSVLTQSSLDILTTWTDMGKYKINYGFGKITGYGLGLMKFEFDGRTFIGHPGSSLKSQSFVFIEPSTGVEIVLLTNCSGNYYNKVFLISILGEIVQELNK